VKKKFNKKLYNECGKWASTGAKIIIFQMLFLCSFCCIMHKMPARRYNVGQNVDASVGIIKIYSMRILKTTIQPAQAD
jgi:hypothetical protein